MKIILSLLFIATLCCSVYAASLNIPVIGWSDKKVFLQKEVMDTYHAEQFKSMLKSLISGSGNKIISAHKPEIITIFVENHLRTDELSNILGSYKEHTDGGDMHAIKENMEHASSSIFIPYATTSGKFVSSAISSLVSDIQGSIIVASNDKSFTINGATYVELDNIKNSLSPSVFNNGFVDILVVVLPQSESFSQHNHHIKEISKLVKGKDSVVFFTAENSTPISFSFDNENEDIPSYVTRLLNAQPVDGSASSSSPNGSTSTYFNYFTGPVLETYMVLSILLTILFTGICCILDLQVPDRYEAPKQKIL